MEFINKFYVKVDKQDLINYVNDKIYDSSLVLEMLDSINEYEKNTGDDVSSFYLSVISKYYRSLSNYFSIPIKRDILINAYMQSLILEKNMEMSSLSEFIINKELNFKENCNLFNYVLEHSMDIDEFLNGQKEKLIFNEKTGLEMGYIYNCGKQKKLS